MMKKFFILFFLILLNWVWSQETEAFNEQQLKALEENCSNQTLEKTKQKVYFLRCNKAYKESHQYRSSMRVMKVASKKFPYDYDIRLQKALSLNRAGSKDRATQELIGLIQTYPNKAELHNYLARIMYPENRIPALMAFLVSLKTDGHQEFQSENIAYIKRLLSTETKKRTTSSGAYGNSFVSQNSMISPVPNDEFSQVEYELNNSKRMNTTDEVSICSAKIKRLAIGLKNTSHRKTGYFWEFYAPYFVDLYENDLTEEFVLQILNKATTTDLKSKEFQALYKLDKSYKLK